MSDDKILPLPALDHVDRQILLALLEDARTSYTDIAKSLGVSPGTIHVRVKKMEKAGIIKGASLHVDYDVLGYGFIAFVGIYLSRSSATMAVIGALEQIPEVTVAHVATGRFGIFAKIRCRDAKHAKEIIFAISDIEGVQNTETMIALEEIVNSSKGLLRTIIER
jgi:Lrp/AsnC family transcriptional regulator for asnA, asnC and gidA